MKDMKFVLLWIALALIVQGCDTAPAKAETKLPAKVEGIVVDHAPRTEPKFIYDESGKLVDIVPAQYYLVIDVNDGSRITIPVTTETAVNAWVGDSITLDCTNLPCVGEQ